MTATPEEQSICQAHVMKGHPSKHGLPRSLWLLQSPPAHLAEQGLVTMHLGRLHRGTIIDQMLLQQRVQYAHLSRGCTAKVPICSCWFRYSLHHTLSELGLVTMNSILRGCMAGAVADAAGSLAPTGGTGMATYFQWPPAGRDLLGVWYMGASCQLCTTGTVAPLMNSRPLVSVPLRVLAGTATGAL